MAPSTQVQLGASAPGALSLHRSSSQAKESAFPQNRLACVRPTAVLLVTSPPAFGTATNTYTMSGISSSASKSAQSGPLQVVTSDANGNLATDGGSIFHELDRLNRRSSESFSGVALAMASVGPDLTRDERFGLSANWGGFEGANAFGMGFEGVLAHDVLTRGDRFALTGGWGVGFAQGGGDDVFGGRVGGQWTWGGHP